MLSSAIGTLATQQAKPTIATLIVAITQLLNYCATNPEATHAISRKKSVT
jgi:hypothetical protein